MWRCDGDNGISIKTYFSKNFSTKIFTLFFLFQDCEDESDEENCLENICIENEFKCNTGKCIPRYMICDSYENCPDGDDELVRNVGY